MFQYLFLPSAVANSVPTNCEVHLQKAFFKHTEREAAAQGVLAIRLDVFSQNPYALKLDQNCGFEKVGTVRWRKGLFYLMEKYLA